MVQLKGKAKREIGRRGEGPQCIQSHCNHVSLLIKTRKGSSLNKLSYSLRPSNDCARCSDSCMEKILCSSDYIFIGLVRKSNLLSDNSSLYKSSIEVQNYLRYNNSYILDSGRSTCTRSPSQFALNSEYAIPSTGIVSVFGKCKLKEGQKYFIGSNLKLGYLSKPRLMLGCAQEDVNFMLYHLNKLLLHNTNTCC
ncbi:PREDICTED: uncharacterized protein LOC109582259 [Amphimedon queenslandica]|nr:PREDICTED: uncharacterized protein LOC109582259 [Amphimedon queenslandica]|eukprot:XP_019852473.1 PREDICTED: uncharacterized protein LOC109582259 [Amphimedon queenslandica]